MARPARWAVLQPVRQDQQPENSSARVLSLVRAEAEGFNETELALAYGGRPAHPALDMFARWFHHECMGLIQIRNVPDDVHRTLKSRAAARGTSLSDYILEEVTRVARTPTPDELFERIRARGPANVSTRDILAARDSGRHE